MAIISEPERSKLYTKVKHVLGAPLRSIELEDEQMDTLLEFSIDEYSQYVQDWLIESQWTALNNLNRRNYITYSMQPMDGRASFANGIYVDRAYRTSTSGTATAPLKDFSSKQLALSLVKNFTCVEKKISGLTKGLNCHLEVYSDLNVNSQLLTYDFEANSEQIY
jgi:hypothetical protein